MRLQLHYITLRYTTLHYTNYITLHYNYNTTNTATIATTAKLHYTALH